ncbi:MAG: M15 family metallopeptidase [Agriterribacter sp.]
MKDTISISRIEQLHPDIREDMTNFINDVEAGEDIILRIVQGLRTFEAQNDIYQQGRTKPGAIVTNAKAGSSYHNYGLAIDVVQMKDGKPNWNYNYKKLRPYYKKYGLTWGADWDGDGKTKDEGDKDEHLVDMPHYEKTFGYNWRQLLEKYNKKDFIPGTSYVKLK